MEVNPLLTFPDLNSNPTPFFFYWMHVRRYFFEAKESDPAQAHEALARIRLLYAVETAAKASYLSGADVAYDQVPGEDGGSGRSNRV